ncbi:YmfQ family protein [Paenibacillus sp. FSL R10-2771]|uniref:YmfQ family protein n=1 Tax=Paenibacillus sp. FSL R10-2771 TaxID=2954693 RepID=UPI0030FA4B8C
MAYGESQYSDLLFSAESNESGEENPVLIDLMQYLPAYYSTSRVMISLQESNGTEIALLYSALNDILKQFFAESATWWLIQWEYELGLPTDLSKSIISRREMIRAKLRGTGTTTPEMIERTASAFSGGEVKVEGIPGQYRFIVRFVGILGIPPNMAGLIQILEEIKPAHLAYEFAYTYTYWESLKTITWNTAGAGTWNDLRTFG